MNTYSKFAPNVFVAKCSGPYEKGDIITLTSKYGKEAEVQIYNLVKQTPDSWFYSFVRCDGYDSQARAAARAEKLQGYADSASKRSDDWVEKANEGHEFLRLGEPIKIGHHSEKRHRALIERNGKRMDNAVSEMRKAESYSDRVAYWEEKAGKVDLSMPESLEYFAFELEKAEAKHKELKNHPEKREYSYSLAYAKKEANEAKKKLQQAELLWG